MSPKLFTGIHHHRVPNLDRTPKILRGDIKKTLFSEKGCRNMGF
jgi:hypothetical protein